MIGARACCVVVVHRHQAVVGRERPVDVVDAGGVDADGVEHVRADHLEPALDGPPPAGAAEEVAAADHQVRRVAISRAHHRTRREAGVDEMGDRGLARRDVSERVVPWSDGQDADHVVATRRRGAMLIGVHTRRRLSILLPPLWSTGRMRWRRTTAEAAPNTSLRSHARCAHRGTSSATVRDRRGVAARRFHRGLHALPHRSDCARSHSDPGRDRPVRRSSRTDSVGFVITAGRGAGPCTVRFTAVVVRLQARVYTTS